MMVPAPEPDLHHGVLERINAGFCVIQVLFDGDRAVDYRFIEVNDAFERHTGLKDARGQRMSALEPHHEEDWFRIYGEVARSGRPAGAVRDGSAGAGPLVRGRCGARGAPG